MARKSTGSSARGARARKNAKFIPDQRIDFSDIPELSDEQPKKMKCPGRPLLGQKKRRLIAIRVDPEILNELNKEAEEEGKGYQSLINEILGNHVKKNVA